jgi:HEAT repeat protein
VLPLARGRLSAADAELRATAVRVLGKLADEHSLAALTSCLDDPEWFVRAAAARVFESIPADARALKALRASLSDRAWWVRSNAAHSLSRQGERGMQILLDVVEGEDRYARDAAIAALALATLTPALKLRLEYILERMSGDAEARSALALLKEAPAAPR